MLFWFLAVTIILLFFFSNLVSQHLYLSLFFNFQFKSDPNLSRHLSVNACLAPVVSMHGCAVTTVEGIGSTKTKLHAVQVSGFIFLIKSGAILIYKFLKPNFAYIKLTLM